MRLMGRGITHWSFKENEKGLGGDLRVTEQGILSFAPHAHTQNKRAVEKGIFLSPSRERPESYIVAGHQVFLVVVVRPAGRGGDGGRLLRATCCFFQCAHPSKPIDRGRCKSERESATGSHLFLRATNQQPLALSAPPETPVIRFPICVPKA